MLARPAKRATLARRDTAIVIDGFLRSGNTFSVAAFQVANGSELHVARHLHGGPHLLRAVRLGLPAVALVRRPVEAVSSYLVRRPSLTPEAALREYLDFYESAWPGRDGFVVALFDDVVDDFGRVIDAVNARFGTSFERYVPDQANQVAAFALVEEMNRRECGGEIVETHVGRPSAEREQRKREVRAMMSLPRARELTVEAERVYEHYVRLARVQAAPAPGESHGS